MKIIRWLLSHSFLILLIVVVIYGYMFWGNLLGRDTPAGKAVAYLSSEFVVVEDFVNAVKAKQASMHGEQMPDHASEKRTTVSTVSPEANKTARVAEEPVMAEAAMTEMSGDHVETQLTQQPAENEVAQIQAQQEPAEIPGGKAGFEHNHDLTAVSTPSEMPETVSEQDKVRMSAHGHEAVKGSDMQAMDTQAATTQGVVQRSTEPDGVDQSDNSEKGAADMSSTEHVFVSPEIEKQLKNVDKQGRVIDETQGKEAVKANWITARKSFYQRNYQLSEQSYRKVIENTEDNFDAYGELGNVYFNQGKNEQAASAYFEAAAILVRKGEVSRARSLLGLLRHLDKSKATELQQLIDSAMS